jgi:hypothetical protein
MPRWNMTHWNDVAILQPLVDELAEAAIAWEDMENRLAEAQPTVGHVKLARCTVPVLDTWGAICSVRARKIWEALEGVQRDFGVTATAFKRKEG